MRDCAPDGCHVCIWKELLCCSALYPTRSLLRTRTIKCLDSKINFSFPLLSRFLLKKKNPDSEGSIEHSYQYNAPNYSSGKQTIKLRKTNRPCTKNQTRSKKSGGFIKIDQDNWFQSLVFFFFCLRFNNNQPNKAVHKHLKSAKLVHLFF